MSDELPDRMQDAEGNVYRWDAAADNWVYAGEGVGVAHGILLGAGERLQSAGRGIAELFGDDEASQAYRDEAQIRGNLQAAAPVSSAVGGALPDVAVGGSVGAFSRGASLVTKLRALSAVAGVEGALGAVAPGEASERLERGMTTAALGVAGFGVGNMAMRIANNIRGSRQAASGSVSDPAQREIFGGPTGGGSTAGAQQVEGADIFMEPPAEGFDPQRGFMGLFDNPVGERSIRELEAIETGLENGVVFEPGIDSGNAATRQAYLSGARTPFFADIAQGEVSEINKGIYERQTLKALGENGRARMSHDTLAGIDERIDSTLSGIHERNPALPLNKTINPNRAPEAPAETVVGGLRRVIDDHVGSARYEGATDPSVKRLEQSIAVLEREAAEGGGNVSSKAYSRLRSELRKEQQKYKRAGDGNAADTMGEAVEALDEWFGASVSEADADLFHKTLQQFRLLQSIDTPGALGNDLALRPGRVAGNLRKNYRTEYARNNRFFRGGNEIETRALDPEIKKFFDLTKTYTAFPNLVGDSGTSTNQFLTNALTQPVGAAVSVAARPAFRKMINLAQPDLADVRNQLAARRGGLFDEAGGL